MCLNPFFPPGSSNTLHLPISRRLQRPAQQLGTINGDQTDGANGQDPPGEAPAPDVGEVEIGAEEGDGAEIDGGGGEDAGGHDPVPGDDLAGDHDELVEDEDGEGEGDHAGGIDAAGEELREPLYHNPLVEGDEDPDAEGAVAERGPRGEFLVEFRVQIREGLVDVAVQHEAEHGGHRVHGRVADQQPVAVQRVRLEARRDAVYRLAHADHEPAVHDELRQFRRPLVAVPPVPHEQFRQVVERRDAEIRRERRLPPFFAHDADPDVGRLDHGDVVAAVADAGDPFLGEGTDQGRHVGFLGRRAAACDHGGELDGGGDEGVAVVGQEVGEGIAVDQKGRGRGFGVQKRERVQGCVRVAVGGEVGDGVDVLRSGDEFGGDGDAARRFDFVAREHPDLDAGIAEELQGRFYVFL